jgi:hypothetical protein
MQGVTSSFKLPSFIVRSVFLFKLTNASNYMYSINITQHFRRLGITFIAVFRCVAREPVQNKVVIFYQNIWIPMVQTLLRNTQYSGSHDEASKFYSRGLWFEFRKVRLLSVEGIS